MMIGLMKKQKKYTKFKYTPHKTHIGTKFGMKLVRFVEIYLE